MKNNNMNNLWTWVMVLMMAFAAVVAPVTLTSTSHDDQTDSPIATVKLNSTIPGVTFRARKGGAKPSGNPRRNKGNQGDKPSRDPTKTPEGKFLADANPKTGLLARFAPGRGLSTPFQLASQLNVALRTQPECNANRVAAEFLVDQARQQPTSLVKAIDLVLRALIVYPQMKNQGKEHGPYRTIDALKVGEMFAANFDTVTFDLALGKGKKPTVRHQVAQLAKDMWNGWQKDRKNALREEYDSGLEAAREAATLDVEATVKGWIAEPKTAPNPEMTTIASLAKRVLSERTVHEKLQAALKDKPESLEELKETKAELERLKEEFQSHKAGLIAMIADAAEASYIQENGTRNEFVNKLLTKERIEFIKANSPPIHNLYVFDEADGKCYCHWTFMGPTAHKFGSGGVIENTFTGLNGTLGPSNGVLSSYDEKDKGNPLCGALNSFSLILKQKQWEEIRKNLFKAGNRQSTQHLIHGLVLSKDLQPIENNNVNRLARKLGFGSRETFSMTDSDDARQEAEYAKLKEEQEEDKRQMSQEVEDLEARIEAAAEQVKEAPEPLDLTEEELDAIHDDSQWTSDLITNPDQSWGDFTVPQLKDECRTRGLAVSGKKADLIERLNAHENEA